MVHPELIDPKRIIVTQCLESRIEEVKMRLKRDFGFQNIIVADTSPVISMHCGPGTLGLMYRYK
jgi:fatty acid-binding protein DegV